MSEKVKINKVETPIDQRETFVSLSKNFSDGTLSVAEKLRVLYALQQTDTEIDRIVSLRGALPQEVEAIEQELASLKSKIAANKELISGFEATIEKNKNDIGDLDNDIARYHEQLGKVTNSREFDSINKELENLGLLREIAQKHINEARMSISEKKDAIEAINDRITIREEDLAAKKSELDNIVESTAKDEAALEAKRKSYTEKLDERTLSAYNRIRASVHNHLAVVPVYENSCGGCFNAITPQKLVDIASGDKLVICEHCGRILVNPLADAE
ncbi:MAG TPA: hypothetical protein DHU75_05500 [Rikenellaceae bacterium]|nr:hypothetical protein [Rikenellaceae bacterium]